MAVVDPVLVGRGGGIFPGLQRHQVSWLVFLVCFSLGGGSLSFTKVGLVFFSSGTAVSGWLDILVAWSPWVGFLVPRACPMSLYVGVAIPWIAISNQYALSSNRIISLAYMYIREPLMADFQMSLMQCSCKACKFKSLRCVYEVVYFGQGCLCSACELVT